MDSKGKFELIKFRGENVCLRMLTVDNVQETYCKLLIEFRRSDTDIYDVKEENGRYQLIPENTPCFH